MIQRIQSVWLLLCSLFSAISFKVPFYSGDWLRDTVPTNVDLNALTTWWLAVISAATGILALVNIFLFKNRKLQLRLCYLGIFLSAALLTLYFLEMENFASGTLAFWCIFHFAILIFYILAARGITRDQKLIRSLDRLR